MEKTEIVVLSTTKKTKKVAAQPVEKVEIFIDVNKLNLVDGSNINMTDLNTALASIKADAERANKGNKAAGRRFRLNTIAISKQFAVARKITPRVLLKK